MELGEEIKRLAAGDRSAFDAIYNATRKAVYYIALSVVKDKSLAEDVMQTTYLSVIRNADKYRHGNAAAWIANIAKNEAIDTYRRRKREIYVDERENPAAFGAAQPDEYGLLIDLARRILNEEEFTVLMLVTACGYKRREIAAMLNVPTPTVTWRYNKAVEKMRKALEIREGEDKR